MLIEKVSAWKPCWQDGYMNQRNDNVTPDSITSLKRGCLFHILVSRVVSTVLLCLVLLPYPLVTYGEDKISDDQLKVVYLLNFAKFIEWPQAKGRDIYICYIAGERFSTYAERIEGAVLKERTVSVRAVMEGDDISQCHILYVGKKHVKDEEWVRKKSRETGVVDIGDSEQYVESGGVISFVVVNNKLRFNINIIEADNRGVSLASDLVELAFHVVR